MTSPTTDERYTESERLVDFDQMTDEELLLEYRATGNAELFEILVQRYERELYNYLRRFLGSGAMAEDAFQGTFLQVFLKSHTFDADRRFRPWLYTVATNQAIDIQRRNKRHRLVSLDRPNRAQHEELGALVDLLESDTPDPADELERGDRVQWIRTAVDALPEQLRSAVSLVYFRGLKYREAADELSVPVGTVKSRLHSAIKRLGQAWSDSQMADARLPSTA